MNMDSIRETCYLLVYSFFQSERKTQEWFSFTNPLLGGISPNEMLEIGRGKELLAFIENQLKENKPPDDLIEWNWPYLRVNSSGAKEYMCPHGVGHGGIHGCDGCCGHESYQRRINARKKKRKRKTK